MTMPLEIISCVLDTKKVEPDNWNTWWDYWNRNNRIIEKIKTNHNRGQADWRGIDIYRTRLYDQNKDIFNFPYVDVEQYLPNMMSVIKELPIDLSVVRAVQSYEPVAPHRDHSRPYLSLRVMLHDNNPRPTFFYITPSKKLQVQKFPESSNTWIYDDARCQHGSFFIKNHSKIILMIYGNYTDELTKFITQGNNKYKSFSVAP